ncbi:MAG: Ig-like domain-containing protein, partial [Verrucomicrobiae bacterium]|nr:Ig-like domain-containing protein [Verrucomicrobiae bacterium]
GDWSGIFFESTSGASVVSNMEVRYAGNTSSPGNSSWYRPSVSVASSASFSNLSILHSDYRPLSISGTDETATFNNLVIDDARSYAIEMANAANPTFTNLSVSRTGANAILASGNIASDRNWNVTAVPYQLSNSAAIDAGATLTLSAGVIVKMLQADSLNVNGNLVSQGTPGSPVIFTSVNDNTVGGDTYNNPVANPVPGSWGQLNINATSTGSVLDNLEVRYGGNVSSPGNGSWDRPAVTISTDLTVSGLTIRNTDAAGLDIQGGANVSLSDSKFVATGNLAGAAVNVGNGSATISDSFFLNNRVGIAVGAGDTATVTGSAFSGNTTAFTNANSDFVSAVATGNWWGDAGGPNDASSADGRTNSNPSGETVGDWVDYLDFLTTRPALSTGLVVLSHSPERSNSPVDTLTVTFSRPIDSATFTTGDVTLTGSSGAIALSAINMVSSTVFEIQLASALAEGSYDLTITQGITGPEGFALDAAYDGTVVYDAGGPRVISQTPSGTTDSSFNEIELVFDEAIDPLSVDASDFSLAGPNGAIQVLSAQTVTANTVLIRFLPQAVNGTYTVTLTPDLSDLAGNLLDQDNDGTGGEVDEDNYSNDVTLDRAALQVISQTPSGTINGTLTFLDIEFSVAILPSSFTTLDVQIIGPNGAQNITGVSQLTATAYRVTFDPPALEGTYYIYIGPEITDPGGTPMDQSGKGVTGTIEDRYEGTFTLDGVGPFVTDSTATGVLGGGTTSIDVTFSRPIRPETFTVADVSLSGPSGSLAISGVAALSATSFRISFAALSESGTYTLEVGPSVLDLVGNLMNQNGNGVNGEVDDLFTANFTIDAVPPTVLSTTLPGLITDYFASITVTFSEAMDQASVNGSSISLNGPAGAITLNSVDRLSSTEYRLNFDQQSFPGEYTLTVGTGVTDAAGTALDQNPGTPDGDS